MATGPLPMGLVCCHSVCGPPCWSCSTVPTAIEITNTGSACGTDAIIGTYGISPTTCQIFVSLGGSRILEFTSTAGPFGQTCFLLVASGPPNPLAIPIFGVAVLQIDSSEFYWYLSKVDISVQIYEVAGLPRVVVSITYEVSVAYISYTFGAFCDLTESVVGSVTDTYDLFPSCDNYDGIVLNFLGRLRDGQFADSKFAAAGHEYTLCDPMTVSLVK